MVSAVVYGFLANTSRPGQHKSNLIPERDHVKAALILQDGRHRQGATVCHFSPEHLQDRGIVWKLLTGASEDSIK
jgi:hypothetical protein